MIELTNSATQTVQPNGTAVFNVELAKTGCDTCHRSGSGQVQLTGKGSCKNPARYEIAFSGVLGALIASQPQIAIAVNGEALQETVRTASIAAATEFYSISACTTVKECCKSCDTVTIKNVGTAALTLSNAALIVRRIA